MASEGMQEDAQLTDVMFIDQQTGWAVGDRGTIWHTTEGGAHWHLQSSGVEHRLESVQFIDESIGWAAGGFSHPYAQATSGIVLHTRDGGRTWKQNDKILLPYLRQIKFFDAKHGWAIGQPSAMFASGLFTTEDGGRSWTPVATAAGGESWLAGDFVDASSGALAGARGALAVTGHRGLRLARDLDVGLRSWRRLRLDSANHGWVAGEGGLVFETNDRGRSWQAPAGGLPAGIREHFDFGAIDARKEHCWVAGTPGTRVLHTADGGRTWELQPTPSTVPIRDLTFVDTQHGWAVGDLGTVLATRDGGRTWKRQRDGGQRAAVSGFFARLTDAPLELVSKLSADEGYLTAIDIVARTDVQAGDPPHDMLAERGKESITYCGASAANCAWQFPVQQAQLRASRAQVVEGWNRAHDGGGLAKLEAHLVRQIRMWRPSVVLTSAGTSSDDATAQVISQLVLRAVASAADPGQFRQQIDQAGLRPWKVQKVYGALTSGQTGGVALPTTQLALRTGKSLAELARPARALIYDIAAAPPATLNFRLLIDDIPQELGKRDFMSGVSIDAHARRAMLPSAGDDLDKLRRTAQLSRNVQAILTRADHEEADDGRLLAEIGPLARGLDDGSAAHMLFQLAERYRSRGKWELAAEAFDAVAARYPKSQLAGPALVWLVQYYASGEAALRVSVGQQVAYVQSLPRGPQPLDDAAESPETGSNGFERQAKGVLPREDGSRVRQARGELVDLRGRGDERLARAAGYARQLESLAPMLHAEPQVQFPLAVARAGSGYSRDAERFYLALCRTRQQDAWRTCAEAEQWLGHGKSEPPKPIWRCRRATTKPRLDGRLDEPIWSGSTTAEMRGAQGDDADWSSVAMLAYDEHYLYLAISCRAAPEFKYTPSDAPRKRDAALAAQDRVELLIDPERDWTTAYRLSVDHRGWTHDECWHDASWHPQWFVASAQEDGAWAIEAAIKLDQLVRKPPEARSAWAVGVQRVVPGVGFASWSQPASPEGAPEGCGLLIFE